MAKNDLQGAPDLLTFKTLSRLGSMHGYGVRMHLRRVSDALLNADWYALTRRGQEQLASRERSCAQVVKGVDAVLRFA